MWGKQEEGAAAIEYGRKRLQAILEQKDATAFLTDEEKKLGKATEIWLTGKELISRGACKDFSLYEKRSAPSIVSFFQYDDKVYKWDNGLMQEYKAAGQPVKDETLIKYEA